MQPGQRVPVELDTQAGRRGHRDRAVDEAQHAGDDHVLLRVLPRPVRVAGVVQVRRGRGEVGHRREADAQVGVGVHRQPDPERLADGGQALRPAQPAPEVVVGQDHLDGVLPHGRGQVLEGHHAHVGRQRHRAPRGPPPPCPRSSASGPRGTPGRRRAPCRRGSTCPRSRRRSGRAAAGGRGTRPAGPRWPGDLLLRREDAALELDRREAVLVHHPPGLRDEAVRGRARRPTRRPAPRGARPTCRRGRR